MYSPLFYAGPWKSLVPLRRGAGNPDASQNENKTESEALPRARFLGLARRQP